MIQSQFKALKDLPTHETDSGSTQRRSRDLLRQQLPAASPSQPSDRHTCRRNNQRGRRQAVKCQLADGSAQWAALCWGGGGRRKG